MIEWKDKNNLTINGFPAFAMSDDLPLSVVKQHNDQLFIQKTKSMLDDHAKHAKHREIKNILEIGLFKGGSAAYFQAMFQASKLVGFDINPEPLTVLERYIKENSLQEKIIMHYGVDQSDQLAIAKILTEAFEPGAIDFIIDDASHFLRETRSTFNTCFPWLQPGGLYIIEDWRWGHWMPDTPSHGGKFNVNLLKKVFEKQPPMTLLGLQLAMVCGTRPDVISEVAFDFHSITVKRGHAALDTNNFDIRNYYAILQTEFINESDKLW